MPDIGRIVAELDEVSRSAREIASLLATLDLLCVQMVGLARQGVSEAPATVGAAQSLLPLARAAHTLTAVGWGRASVCGDRLDALAAEPLQAALPPGQSDELASKLRHAGADARATCSTLEAAGQALERAIGLLECRAVDEDAAWQTSREIFEGVMARLGAMQRGAPGGA
ncbi:hypothetical protein OOT46_08500 [Aquabacterium sp. A7-Y]|uniref:hypothetical protein n=1 Tax=Aquabacterium sp. A7-Y TaxID=1349605 RepID=UPI00223E6FC4|nr:hypothetical protein [Aquabacterium sp. A7-Y]MCW7537887.1 hypothetical protein [Aquabacterium sp. A7-Y]